MGFEIDGQALNVAFKRFKEIADRKKQVTAMDLEALVTDELREDIAGYALEWFDVESSSRRSPHAKVGVTLPDGTSVTGSFVGDGPIDAIFQAINAATATSPVLSEFTIGAVTEGQDALGEVSVVVELDGVDRRRSGALHGHHRCRRPRLRACPVGGARPLPGDRRRRPARDGLRLRRAGSSASGAAARAAPLRWAFGSERAIEGVP